MEASFLQRHPVLKDVILVTKDEKLLRELEIDYERAQKALQFLEEQIREVKNRIQGTEKRNLPRP